MIGVATYGFLTSWVIAAPRERVWDAIWQTERWPQWWRGVEDGAEIDRGDADGIGRRGSYTWRSRIPYPVRLEVVSTRVEPYELLEGEISGDLDGLGRWLFFDDGTATAVLFECNVQTTKRWMNVLAPLAHPAFAWNHDQIMRWGGEGLAEHLGCRLLAST